MEHTPRKTINYRKKGDPKLVQALAGKPHKFPKDVENELEEQKLLMSDEELAGSVPSGPKKPRGKDLTDAIIGVIEGLDPGEDYTAEGKPSIRALTMVLGYDITPQERDDALAALKALLDQQGLNLQNTNQT